MEIYLLKYMSRQHYVAADNEAEAMKLGMDPVKYPDIAHLPFKATKIVVPGVQIVVHGVFKNQPVEEVPVEQPTIVRKKKGDEPVK